MELDAIPRTIHTFAIRERLAVSIAVKFGAIPRVVFARAVRIGFIRRITMELRTIPLAILARAIIIRLVFRLTRSRRAVPVRADACAIRAGFGRLIAARALLRLNTLPVAFDKPFHFTPTRAFITNLILTAALQKLRAYAIFTAFLNETAILRARDCARLTNLRCTSKPDVVNLVRIGATDAQTILTGSA